MTALTLWTPPSRGSCDTFREAVVHIGVTVGLDPSGAWLVGAELQTELLIETERDFRAPTQLESVRRNLEETLPCP